MRVKVECYFVLILSRRNERRVNQVCITLLPAISLVWCPAPAGSPHWIVERLSSSVYRMKSGELAAHRSGRRPARDRRQFGAREHADDVRKIRPSLQPHWPPRCSNRGPNLRGSNPAVGTIFVSAGGRFGQSPQRKIRKPLRDAGFNVVEMWGLEPRTPYMRSRLRPPTTLAKISRNGVATMKCLASEALSYARR